MVCALSTTSASCWQTAFTLAYGHHAVPPRVEHDAPAGGDDGATGVLTAAEARNRRIPLRKQKYAPAGQDTNQCFSGARRACDTTLQDGDVVANHAPAATALPSTAPPRLDAPTPVVLYEYI